MSEIAKAFMCEHGLIMLHTHTLSHLPRCLELQSEEIMANAAFNDKLARFLRNYASRMAKRTTRKLGRNIHATFLLVTSNPDSARTTLADIDLFPYQPGRLQFEEKFRRMLERRCYWWCSKTSEKRLVESLIMATEDCVKEYNQSRRAWAGGWSLPGPETTVRRRRYAFSRDDIY